MALEFIAASLILVLVPSIQGQTSSCFSKMSQKTGVFSSPRYPYQYPANSFCEYIIRSPSDSYIEITFTHFELERPSNGVKTDYITILDGGSKNRRQILIYDGSQSAPFTFRSETSRVLIIFRSNDMFEYKGFRAVYRRVKKCKPLSIEHAKVVCDVTAENLASHCNVTCDKRFVLQGDERMQCVDGGFPTTPTCIVKPEYACTSGNFRNIFKKTSKTWWITLETCVKDNSTGQISKCNYECAKNYIDTGNGAIECVNGVIEEEAQCLPDPNVMEKCLESNNTGDCPFADQQGFLAVMEEESKEFEELPNLGRATGKKGQRRYPCDEQVCRKRRSGKYLWSCPKYAKVCRMVFKESKSISKIRKKVCSGCQSGNGCKKGKTRRGRRGYFAIFL